MAAIVLDHDIRAETAQTTSWDFPLARAEARKRIADVQEHWESLAGDELWEHSARVLRRQGHLSQGEGPSTLTIFDWDDTLLPNSVLRATGHIPAKLSTELGADLLGPWADEVRCARAVRKALRSAKSIGRVAIVTNAASGWVQRTAATFLPGVEQELEDVAIFGAQSMYKPLGFDDPVVWKVLSFQRILRRIGGVQSLLSVGDGWFEREAVLSAGKASSSQCYVKSMKFVEEPSIEEFLSQLDQFSRNCQWLAGHYMDVDGMMPGNHSENQGLNDQGREDCKVRIGYEVAKEQGQLSEDWFEYKFRLETEIHTGCVYNNEASETCQANYWGHGYDFSPESCDSKQKVMDTIGYIGSPQYAAIVRLAAIEDSGCPPDAAIRPDNMNQWCDQLKPAKSELGQDPIVQTAYAGRGIAAAPEEDSSPDAAQARHLRRKTKFRLANRALR